jgi:HEPN domain-containing protein
MSDLASAMWRQAQRDLEHARKDATDGFFEWAAYSAQQAGEKAVKAVLLAAGADAPRLHSLNALLDAAIAAGLATSEDKAALQEALRALDVAFAISRYPRADLELAPADLVGEAQARATIDAAERVLAFGRGRGLGRA